MTKRKPQVEPVAVVSPDEQALRARFAEVEQQLAAIEGELRQQEAERDAAEAIVESVRARAGGSVELWRSEEMLHAARRRISELLGQREPLAEEHLRLRGYLQPIDAERAQLDTVRRALAAWEKLAEVLPLLDQVAAVVDEAAKLGANTGGQFAVPSSLQHLMRQLGPKATGMSRHQVVNAIRTHLDSKRAIVARLGGDR
ncbi:hypothetical protein [Verrucosispora sp. WMMD1129]|uniref:hypothetical protein n=1 Tax=Verrucosispora sp. WMMD1129 TaxID=3016093 RepID=UPI00249A57C0|nr:hypothetical protein [Verrucosispora sp. WMMD1129]WFE44271.1 hypothetical protein O7624_07945 [Verrucosispora sp. WMMD1129]